MLNYGLHFIIEIPMEYDSDFQKDISASSIVVHITNPLPSCSGNSYGQVPVLPLLTQLCLRPGRAGEDSLSTWAAATIWET